MPKTKRFPAEPDSLLNKNMDRAERRVRDWIDDVFPLEEFPAVDERSRDAAAIKIVRDIRRIDRTIKH